MLTCRKSMAKLDALLCVFFGLKSYAANLDSVQLINNEILVSNHEPHKRIIYKETWKDFLKTTFRSVSEDEKLKLGIALGKTLADNLVISFEQSQVHI